MAAGGGAGPVGGAAVALTSAAEPNGDMNGAGLATTTTTPPASAMEVEVGLSPAPMTSPGGGGGGERSPTVNITDDDVINLAGPSSSPGGPRIELKMTVGELRKARLSRSAEFKQLLMAMLNDPIVQAGELDVVTQSNCPTPLLTEHNSSGAAAAAAAARSQAAVARALEDTTRAMALLASGRERDRAGGHGGGGFAEGPAPVPSASGNAQETRRGGGFPNGGGGGGTMDLGLVPPPPREQRFERRILATESADPGGVIGSAERSIEPPLRGVKRGRPDTDLGGVGGGKRPSGVGGEVQGARGVGAGFEYVGEASGLAASSKRRRQLWMLAIRENELRHERRKEEARKEYETRQQELLRWMIDEEAGRHNGLDGDAGPPPIAEWERGSGSHAI